MPENQQFLQLGPNIGWTCSTYHAHTYSKAKNIGEELNLVDKWFWKQTANQKFPKISVGVTG